jgi:aminobenzoyl-glutamate utilization protein B
MALEDRAMSFLDENEQFLARMAKDIFDHPETAFKENYAADLLASFFTQEGFDVKRKIAGLPTAFTASWGAGKPCIGILGEYDALPGLSQKVSADREPVVKDGSGHGCGHNLLGVGSLGAAVAVKRAMAEHGLSGTVRFYGCPAEETLSGKVFMARAGVFNDLDAALGWHPWYTNSVWWSSSSALNSFKINFHGLAAHAGDVPESGRSALDAVILMDVGVNYLREHIIKEAKVHSVITRGGSVPNVVPDYAQIWYYARAPRRDQLETIYRRILKIAEGAALMTETTCDVEFVTGCYNFLQNRAIGDVMLEKLHRIGAPCYTPEEKAFAGQLVETLKPGDVEDSLKFLQMDQEQTGYPLCDRIFDQAGGINIHGGMIGGSTDVGDVAQIVPTGQLTTTCKPLGVAQHSWQNTACCGSSIGLKGMMLAAKALALTALELFTKPQILEAAAEEHRAVTGGRKNYRSPLPDDTRPPV